MKSVSVLVVVDVEAALASNDLQSHLYMVDTNGKLGSYNEGGNELVTACYDTQTIYWRVESVDPDGDVAISEFTGQMVNDRVCMPKKEVDDPEVWKGVVETQGEGGSYQYSMTLQFDGGVTLSFDPWISVTVE
ncbi:alpha-pore-forming tripartite toxin MakABE regulator [Anaeromicropila populeti]|uniref:Inclusion body protein n=1 Tax=Anaeromicropila populeti TaxID=37658 RepID=A0A1I6IA58_9FIRM|nr:hypothetical protein [Anaeromicropila populeti]SFR63647.1 hypothetical protein SAMN05661086_00611 [Anaeromicropila populeti]